MKIYGIKACDTCRKALKMLQDAGVEVALVDVRDAPLGRAQLHKFYTKFGSDLVNTRSTTWRNLSEEDRQQDSIALLEAHPTLMKRPVIESDDLYLGWKKDVQDALL